jgi:hypothetical protein
MDKCLFDKENRKIYRLVHGRPTLKVPPFIKYGHAWVEIDGVTVFDTEHHKEVPKELYYAVGNIDSEDCLVYTYSEMAAHMRKHEHWGPWELPEDPEETELREALNG